MVVIRNLHVGRPDPEKTIGGNQRPQPLVQRPTVDRGNSGNENARIIHVVRAMVPDYFPPTRSRAGSVSPSMGGGRSDSSRSKRFGSGPVFFARPGRWNSRLCNPRSAKTETRIRKPGNGRLLFQEEKSSWLCSDTSAITRRIAAKPSTRRIASSDDLSGHASPAQRPVDRACSPNPAPLFARFRLASPVRLGLPRWLQVDIVRPRLWQFSPAPAKGNFHILF